MKQALAKSHDKYVLVPVDKTTGNVAIIFQRFYALTSINSLGWTEIL